MLMSKRKNSRFYTILQTTMSHKKERGLALLIGDLNAKVGADNLGFERVTGRHRMGKMKKKICGFLCKKQPNHRRYSLSTYEYL